MKLFARPNSFYEAMTSVMYFNYLLGLRVFEYPRGYPRSVFSFIYILIIYIMFCGGAVSMGVYLENIKLLKLDYIIFLVTGNMYILSVILKMILGWRHSKEITVCHKKIFQIDKTLRELGLEVNYDRVYFMTIGFMTSWFILFIFISSTGFIYFQARSDTLHAIYIIFVLMMSVSVDYVNAFEFYAFSRLVHTKFELINHLLRETIRILSEQETKLDTFKLKDYTKLLDFEQQKGILSIKKNISMAPTLLFCIELCIKKTLQLRLKIKFIFHST
ncbi:hypothetical protein PUN28_010902 [Cardiocondyla obscurior]|uniref:Gustatory receptor n=1 Tax=Cardiocondyla obscurior TaxID=286306 RepID=A0AAW2FJS6_9HYME